MRSTNARRRGSSRFSAYRCARRPGRRPYGAREAKRRSTSRRRRSPRRGRPGRPNERSERRKEATLVRSVQHRARAKSRRIHELARALTERAAEEIDTIMPGYTHLQRAQPVSLAHHLLAHVEAFRRDRARVAEARGRTATSPLGAGALAGAPYPLDPASVAKELGLDRTFRNSIDAVSDRDFVADFVYVSALTAMHASRLAEELVLWTSTEFGFAEFADTHATGSSIMPQKKNPDVAEI